MNPMIKEYCAEATRAVQEGNFTVADRAFKDALQTLWCTRADLEACLDPETFELLRARFDRAHPQPKKKKGKTHAALAWTVFDQDGNRSAAFVHAADAAAFVALLGDGSTIKCGHKTVWREGEEENPAGDSYDRAALVMHERSAQNGGA